MAVIKRKWIYKGRKRWRYVIKIGDGYWETLPEGTTKEEAKRRNRELEQQFADTGDLPPREGRHITLAEFIDRYYLPHARTHRRSEKSYKRAERICQDIRRALGRRRLASIRQQDVLDFEQLRLDTPVQAGRQKERPRAHATVLIELSVLIDTPHR